MKLYRWRIEWRCPTNCVKQHDIVAPSLNEALRVCIQECPAVGRGKDGTCCGGHLEQASVTRHESIDAIWYPVSLGPREPTIEEQARAEVDALVGA